MIALVQCQGLLSTGMQQHTNSTSQAEKIAESLPDLFASQKEQGSMHVRVGLLELSRAMDLLAQKITMYIWLFGFSFA